ncbi:MAG: ADP-ribosylation factor-like protein [Candidatus Hodarchaeales archaeon]|jgi:small GTP-binding protein
MELEIFTIVNRLLTGKFSNPSRTMGLNVDSVTYEGMEYQTYDMGGQMAFRDLWEAHVRSATAVVYAIDSAAPTLFVESHFALQECLVRIPPKSLLVILANKSDLEESVSLSTIIRTFEWHEIQTKHDFRAINLFQLSAKSGENFDDAFEWLFETIIRTTSQMKI